MSGSTPVNDLIFGLMAGVEQVRRILDQSVIGIVPLNWRYEPAKMKEFLSGIAHYGFRGIQISGEQAESVDFLREMRVQDIAPAEQYLAIRCDEDGPLSGSEAESAKTIQQAVAARVEMIVFAVDGTEGRDRSAGRVDLGPHLSELAFTKLAAHIETFAKLAATHGIKSSFHPHAGTYVESENETCKLMNQLDPQLVGLCLDVGHWIVAGEDPIKAVRDFGKRITHVHIKDVSGEILENMLTGEIPTMNVAVEEFKLFVPAGTGLLKLRDFLAELEKVSFCGWLMSEQDSAWEPSEVASGVSIANIQNALT